MTPQLKNEECDWTAVWVLHEWPLSQGRHLSNRFNTQHLDAIINMGDKTQHLFWLIPISFFPLNATLLIPILAKSDMLALACERELCDAEQGKDEEIESFFFPQLFPVVPQHWNRSHVHAVWPTYNNRWIQYTVLTVYCSVYATIAV